MKTRSKNILATLSAAFAAAMALAACNAEDDMQLSYQHTVQAGLYSMHTHNDTTLTKVQIFGIGREDSLLYDEESIGKLFLNLNLSRCTTEYVFCTQTLQDDIFFTYQKQKEPVSGSSGIAMELTLDSVGHTTTFIDSIAVVESKIRYNESLENIKIFIY